MSGQGIWAAFTGRLGRDVDFRMVKSGTMPMAALNMAVTLDEKGTVQWLRAVAFKDLADKAREWAKGEIVSIEGWLKLDQWSAADGTPRHGLSVIAVNAHRGYRRRPDGQPSKPEANDRRAPEATAARRPGGNERPDFNDSVEDIGR